MNYIKQLNAFWRWRRINEINHSEADLYFAILDCFSSSGWKKSLSIPNSTLMNQTQASKSQFVRSRATLLEKGLIKYEKGTKKASGIYTLIPLIDITYGTNPDTNQDTNCGTIIKNKYKNKNIYLSQFAWEREHLSIYQDDYDHEALIPLTLRRN